MTYTDLDLSEQRPIIIADDGNQEVEFGNISHEDAAAEYVKDGEWHIDEVGHASLVIWTWEPEWMDEDGFEQDGFHRVRHTIETADFFTDENHPRKEG